MSASGTPNGGGPNPPTDPEPDQSETNSPTTSSNMTIPEHEFDRYYMPRFGRRFHSFPRSPYFLPADDEEATRLREQHEILQGLVGEGYYNLLADRLRGSELKYVLDLGCGPGTWVEEFSQRYPSAYFIGIDLVPMARQLLDDAHIEIYDLSMNGIQRDADDVDAIHMRCLSFGYGRFDSLLVEARRVLVNGGLIFSIEIDWRFDQQDQFPRLSLQHTREFLQMAVECATLVNTQNAWDPTLIPRWLTDFEFSAVQREVRLLPVGPWSGSQPMRELGSLVQRMCVQFAEAMKPTFKYLLRQDPAQVDHFIAQVQRELSSEETEGWSIPVHLVTASKAPVALPTA